MRKVLWFLLFALLFGAVACTSPAAPAATAVPQVTSSDADNVDVVAVYVRNNDGVGVEGATVSLTYGESTQNETSKSFGFTVFFMPGGVLLTTQTTVTVSAPGYATATRQYTLSEVVNSHPALVITLTAQ